MPRNGQSTRAEIMHVAMTRFVQQGYDKTSLREIAEACGVTKAALYYYFRTKDEIVRAALEEYSIAMRELLDWIEATPRSMDRNRELVDRVLELLDGNGAVALRFVQANPTVLARDDFGERHVDYVKALVKAIAGPDPSADAALRATMTVGVLMLSSLDVSPIGPIGDADERRTAARELALQTLAPISERDGERHDQPAQPEKERQQRKHRG
jgi:AcrR family transcriptional regulator